ncbi:hypothetical protein ACFX15_046421 [Malus domestica]
MGCNWSPSPSSPSTQTSTEAPTRPPTFCRSPLTTTMTTPNSQRNERRRGGWGFGASESSPSSQSFYISATGGVSSLNLDCSSATGGDVEDTGGLSCSSSWLP